MTFEQLTEGQEIEMFWHFYTDNYFWKKGTVSIIKDGKYFLPQGMVTKLKILRHRMDEVREIQ